MSTVSDKFLVHYGGESGALTTDDKSGITLTNTNVVTSVTGKIGNAFHFVADSEQYMTVADTASLRLTTAINEWKFWAKLNSKTGTGTTFCCKDDTGGEREYVIMFHVGFDRVRMELRTNPSDASEVSILSLDTFGSPTVGVWNFYEFRTNGTNLYGCVNRGAEDSVAATFSGRPTAAAFQMGTFGTVSGYYADCDLDGFLFGKTAFTTDERDFIYNGGAGSNWARLLAGPSAPAATKAAYYFSQV